MANFFIIDHSLKDAGGHHFDYTRCVARAASEMGFAPIVATHRSFKPNLWQSSSPPLNSLGGSIASQDFSQTFRENSQSSPSPLPLRARPTSTSNRESNSNIQISPSFRQTTYQRDSYLAGLQHLTRSRFSDALQDESKINWTARWKHRLRFLPHRRRREIFVKQFAIDCERFFAKFPQQPGDHVLLTTISELELMGLAIYLAKHPESLNTHWHLQFHFNLFDGRPNEYSSQSRTSEAITACFMASLSRLSYHSINFYTTSDTLADQYNRLGVGTFRSLPYPIAPHFQSSQKQSHRIRVHTSVGNQSSATHQRENESSFEEMAVLKLPFDPSPGFSFSESPVSSELSESGPEATPEVFRYQDYLETRPSDHQPIDRGSDLDTATLHRGLRFTCPGAIRREKGQASYLQNLVDELWDTHLSTGQIHLVVQRPKPRLMGVQKIELQLPPSSSDSAPIHYVSHPLPQDDYVNLIRNTDVGLLYYDSRVYYSRRAGVLGELLAAGKPVIVSAGSWLAEQISESNFSYADRVVRESNDTQTLGLSDLKWNADNVPLPGGVVSFDRHRHPFEFNFSRPKDYSAVAVNFQWHWPKESGVYCRLELVEVDAQGNEICSQSRVLGGRDRNAKPIAIFCLSESTVEIRCTLRNAFNDSTASVRQLSISLISTEENAAIPTGSVGLIATDEDNLIKCVGEMVEFYDHYRQSAEAFSSRWYANHDPKLTISHLLAAEESFRRVA